MLKETNIKLSFGKIRAIFYASLLRYFRWRLSIRQTKPALHDKIKAAAVELNRVPRALTFKRLAAKNMRETKSNLSFHNSYRS